MVHGKSTVIHQSKYLKAFASSLMRIWDISPELLCRQHLLGEHRELHAIWSVIQNNKKGYSKHPETIRWQGKTNALYSRHELEVKEMKKRGYQHHSSLDFKLASGDSDQKVMIDSITAQKDILKKKRCNCTI
jgi:hypothetical protein